MRAVRHPSQDDVQLRRGRIGLAPRAASRAALASAPDVLGEPDDRRCRSPPWSRWAKTISVTRSSTSRSKKPHKQLVVDAHARVEVRSAEQPLALEASAAWETVRAQLADLRRARGVSSMRSRRRTSSATMTFAITRCSRLRAAAADSRGGDGPHEPHLSRVSSIAAGCRTCRRPCSDVFAMRQGVCQDFAHLEIACSAQPRARPRATSAAICSRGRPRAKRSSSAPTRRTRGSRSSPAIRLGRLRPDEQRDSRRRAHHVRAGAATTAT